VAVGIVIAAWAIPMFAAPEVAAGLWPWTLSALTARVIAGWVGVAASLALVAGATGDTRSVRLPLLGWTITVVLFLLASAVNLSAFEQSDLRTPMYFGALLASVVGAAWLLVRVQGRMRDGPA
jgi:hypothetical protein